MLREQLDVVPALAERREVDPEDAEAEVEVLPQASFGDRGLGIQFVAAMMRTSNGTSCSPPTRCSVSDSSTRRSFTWRSIDISVISSRSSVPPRARSK